MFEEFIPSIGEVTRNLIIALVSYGLVLLWKRVKTHIFTFRPPGWLSAALVLYLLITSVLFAWGYYQKHKPYEKNIGKIFDHETVVLDGKSFKQCIFRKCTLVIKGTRAFSLSSVEIYDSGFSLQDRAKIGENILLAMKEQKSMEPYVINYFERLKYAKINYNLPPLSLEDL